MNVSILITEKKKSAGDQKEKGKRKNSKKNEGDSVHQRESTLKVQ